MLDATIPDKETRHAQPMFRSVMFWTLLLIHLLITGLLGVFYMSLLNNCLCTECSYVPPSNICSGWVSTPVGLGVLLVSAAVISVLYAYLAYRLTRWKRSLGFIVAFVPVVLLAVLLFT